VTAVAVHTYECLFLLDPNKWSADMEGVANQANGVLTRHGAEVLLTRPWGEHKLAYPISNFRKGVYLLTYFRAEAEALAAIEADVRLSEYILRKMIIKLHPHVAEDILAHYTNEQEQPVEEPAA